MSWILVAVLAAAGFAAFSPDTDEAAVADPAPIEAADAIESQLVMPAVSARTAAFVMAESLEFKGTFAVRPDPPQALAVLGPDGASTTTTTSTTTTSTTTTTTTTAPVETAAVAASPQTTSAPKTTTTTKAPTTTTTAAPAATTTTAPPADTTTTTAAPAPAGTGVERWRPLVEQYFRAELVNEALFVIKCESGGNPSAVNSRSGAAGLFQFMPSTWGNASRGAGFAGVSALNGEANIAAASWLVEDSIRVNHPRGPWGHWSCRP